MLMLLLWYIYECTQWEEQRFLFFIIYVFINTTLYHNNFSVLKIIIPFFQ